MTKKKWQDYNYVVGNSSWDSGLKTSKPCIYLEGKVNGIISTIQKYVGTDEFSILFKGHWSTDGFVVSNEYYIPKQDVSGASVDYEENIGELRRKKDYNVVVHSHPFSTGSGGYSGADDDHINTHFPCSILTDKHGDVIAATLKLDTPNNDYKIIIPIDVDDDIRYYPVDDEIVVGLDNIKSDYGLSGRQQHFSNYDYGLDGFKKDDDGVYRRDDTAKKKEETEEADLIQEQSYCDIYDV